MTAVARELQRAAQAKGLELRHLVALTAEPVDALIASAILMISVFRSTSTQVA